MSTTFMIIDDDDDDRFFCKEGLMKIPRCHECMEANGCIEAFELLRKSEHLPQFIFMDIKMPIIDGRDCLKQLKKDKHLKHIPLIMYSTSFSKESINEFQKVGAFNCLPKPSDIKNLPDQILLAIRQSLAEI